MELNRLKPKMKTKRPKRVGRGPGTGHGKTAGRGHKGTGQRKGRSFYIGFEGGNVPYLRKIPKRGFNPKRRREFQIVNLETIVDKLKDKEEITPKQLEEANLIKDKDRPVKILAKLKSNLSFKATFKAHKFSRRAFQIIEESGGKAECLSL